MIDLSTFSEQNPAWQGRLALLGLFETYCSLNCVTTLCQQRVIIDLFEPLPEKAWVQTFESLAHAQVVKTTPDASAIFLPGETSAALRHLLAEHYADIMPELERRFADHYATNLSHLLDIPSDPNLAATEIPSPLHPEQTNLRRALEWAVQHRLWRSALGILKALEKLIIPEAHQLVWKSLLATLGSPATADFSDATASSLWEAVLHHRSASAGWDDDLATQERNVQLLRELYQQRGDLKAVATNLRRLGQIAGQNQQFVQAREYYLAALETRQKANDPSCESALLMEISATAMAEANWDDAVTWAQRSLNLARERSEVEGELAAWKRLGEIADRSGHAEEAATHYRKTVELAGLSSHAREEASALELLGDLDLRRGHNEPAERWFHRSARIWKQVGAERNEARVWTKIGDAWRNLGSWQKAEVHYRESLQIQVRLRDRAGQAQTLSRLGLLALERQELAQASAWFGQGESLLDESSEGALRAAIFDGLGTIAYLENSFDRAERYYKESLRWREALGHGSEQARVLYNLGLAAERKKELAAARQWHERSCELSSALGETNKQLQALLQLASIAFQQGNLQEAARRCEEALLLAEKGQARREQAEIHYRLGRIAQELLQPGAAQRYRRSLEIYREEQDLTGHMKVVGYLGTLPEISREELAAAYRHSLILAEKLGATEHLLTLLYKLAEIGEATEHWHDAEVCYRRCLTMEEAVGSKIQQAYVLQKLGLILEHEGRPAEMEALLQRSIKLGGFPNGDQPFHTTVLERLGMAALRRQEFEDALLYFQHGLKVAEDHGDSTAEAKAVLGLGRIAAARGDREHALAWLERTLQLSAQDGNAKQEITALIELGELAQRSGEAKLAERHYTAALKLQQRLDDDAGTARMLVRLGEISEELDREKKALAYFEQAAAIYASLHDAQNLYRTRTALQRLRKP